MNPIYTCEVCGTKTTGQTTQELFKAGWDTPPHFTTHVTCPTCPITKTAVFVMRDGISQ
jgi:hypothetical protein